MSQLETVTVEDEQPVARYLTEIIREHLEAQRHVLWLVSGGSSIQVAANTMKLLSPSSHLTISLVDDKFESSSEGANDRALRHTGLSGHDSSYSAIEWNEDKTVMAHDYEIWLRDQLDNVDVALGQFGLGSGYHTGGILPGSPVASEHESLVAHYEQDGRVAITVTPGLIARLDITFINSCGELKRPLVAHFIASLASIREEPTQALKSASRAILVSDVLPN